MTFLEVPGGTYRIGTTWQGVLACVNQWRGHLINPCYQEQDFKNWIAKEYPDHVITCSAFSMQQTVVSNGDAQLFISATDAAVPESITSGAPADHPVWGVSIQWARDFARWLSMGDRHYIYRLPTETEWEVAARGHDFREYPYGHEFDPTRANTRESGHNTTTPILFFESSPGPFGHLDLAGNVEEWADSRYYVYDGGFAVQDDLYERFGLNYFILRGGSFACGGDLSRGARRHGPFPDPLFRYTGFRLVRELRQNP